MKFDSRIYVAGHTGLVGSAVVARLRDLGYGNILTVSRKNLDLRDQAATRKWFSEEKPEYVFVCCGLVGGIMANNSRGGEFLYDNLMMQTNVIDSAAREDVGRLIAIGSSCIYPATSSQPIIEEYLMSGPLEPTNEAYAVSKIAALMMCKYYRRQYGCDFISAMPCNLYGPNDNYNPSTSHVLPAMIRNFYNGLINYEKHVVIYGSGKPRREFMYVDDCADALVFLMNSGYHGEEHVNIGTGSDISIQDLAVLISEIVGYKGEILNDVSKPDGMYRKLLDSSKINSLGWRPTYSLAYGIEKTYQHFKGGVPRENK